MPTKNVCLGIDSILKEKGFEMEATVFEQHYSTIFIEK